jgi:hypothetical protein
MKQEVLSPNYKEQRLEKDDSTVKLETLPVTQSENSCIVM